MFLIYQQAPLEVIIEEMESFIHFPLICFSQRHDRAAPSISAAWIMQPRGKEKEGPWPPRMFIQWTSNFFLSEPTFSYLKVLDSAPQYCCIQA
jgi:hypothetical protein